MADANAANLSPATVIEFAITFFLGSGDTTVISTPVAHVADDGSSLAELHFLCNLTLLPMQWAMKAT